WSNTQITIAAPSSIMTAAIIVSVGGVYSNTDVNLTIIGPTVTSVSPTTGPVGTQVTINGSGFGSSQGSNSVTFNSGSASVTSWSDTQIVATVPSTASAGPVRVTVGGAGSNATVYFPGPPPQLTGASPPSGRVATPGTITGSTSQSTHPASGYVYFNGVYAPSTTS